MCGRALSDLGAFSPFFVAKKLFQWNTLPMGDETILHLRERLNLSQEDLAMALGVQGRLTVYRWEVGTREPSETIRRLVLLLNDLSQKDAKKLLARLQSYGTRENK
jgi:DNA-binding transcriptional regulator YiaG